MARFPGVLLLRFSACFWALSHLYTPRWLELRFNSRVTVDGWTPMASAIDLFEHFLCSNTEIVYLCSEVNCLYISNAKLINLWETSVSLFDLFHLHCWILARKFSHGGCSPPNPSVFSGIRFYLYLYLKIALLSWTYITHRVIPQFSIFYWQYQFFGLRYP